MLRQVVGQGGKGSDRQQTRMLVADSDARVRQALHTLLGQEPGPVVIRESPDVASLAIEVRDFQPDLILLDWELPGRPAAALLFASQNLLYRSKMIVISRRPEDRQMALAAGADAFVSKGDPPERPLRALDEIDGKKESKGEEPGNGYSGKTVWIIFISGFLGLVFF